MHVLINHAPEFGELYGSLKGFEMEDIEYLNYENKLIFFGASNKLSRRTYTSEQVISVNIYKFDHKFPDLTKYLKFQMMVADSKDI